MSLTPWYILDPGFSSEQAKKLESEGVALALVTISEPKQLTQYAFPEEDIKIVRKFLNITSTWKGYYTLTNSNDIRILEFKPDPSTLQQTMPVAPFSGRTQASIASAEAFARARSASQQVARVNLTEQIEQTQKGISGLENQLASLRTKLNQQRTQLNELNQGVSSDEFKEEFFRLEQHPDIAQISIASGVLVVVTNLITIRYGNANYRIGRFKISILLKGENERLIRINNLDSLESGAYDHPFVRMGSPCWGNYTTGTHKYLVEKEYGLLIETILTFLKHFSTTGGPYRNVTFWPQVI